MRQSFWHIPHAGAERLVVGIYNDLRWAGTVPWLCCFCFSPPSCCQESWDHNLLNSGSKPCRATPASNRKATTTHYCGAACKKEKKRTSVWMDGRAWKDSPSSSPTDATIPPSLATRPVSRRCDLEEVCSEEWLRSHSQWQTKFVVLWTLRYIFNVYRNF